VPRHAKFLLAPVEHCRRSHPLQMLVPDVRRDDLNPRKGGQPPQVLPLSRTWWQLVPQGRWLRRHGASTLAGRQGTCISTTP